MRRKALPAAAARGLSGASWPAPAGVGRHRHMQSTADTLESAHPRRASRSAGPYTSRLRLYHGGRERRPSIQRREIKSMTVNLSPWMTVFAAFKS